MQNGLVFGGISTVLSLSYDPESQCWKTCQQSLFEDYQQSLDRYPRSGMTVNGKLYRLDNSVLPTSENGGFVLPIQKISETNSSLLTRLINRRALPTPTKSDGAQASILNENTKIKINSNGTPRKISNQGVEGSVSLARLVLLPTPTKSDYKNNPLTPSRHTGKHHLCLNTAIGKAMKEQKITGQDFQLSPQFVEEMMGFPIGWTELKHSEMQ